MAESISLEETNAIRKKLGLPELSLDAEQVNPDQEAYDNYQKLKDEQERESKAQDIKKRIEKSKNRKRNLEKLQGKGLADGDDDDESALSWIKKSRKREKDTAARRAKELEEMDNAFQSYDASNLSGLKVGHSMNEFDEGSETILTLKDRGILDENDEDADELTNVSIEDRERLKKNLDLKKQKPGYNPYDDDQFNGSKQSILPQYEDEEDDVGFTIGKSGTIKMETKKDEKTVSQKLKEQTLSYEKMREIKDYYTQEEMDATFKKPKTKKKKKSTRKRNKEVDEDDIVIPETSAPIIRERTFDPDANFVDDDDLQQALARSRRVANKERNKLFKKMTPEEIAKKLQQEKQEEEDEEVGGGLVLSETTEFVNSLGIMPTFVPKEATVPAASESPVPERPRTPEQQVEEEEAKDEPIQDLSTRVEEAKESEDEFEPIQEEDIEMKDESKDEIPMEEEPLVSGGIAATLQLLNQKGIIAKPTEEQLKRDKIATEQIRWQNEQRKRERLRAIDEQREKERRRGGNEHRGRDYDRDRQREEEREREREKEREEAQRMREYDAAMQNYKPEVVLEYTDDSGRVMDTREAFRYMSHKFHGKTSGKLKTEKRMQKVEEERKLNMMSSTDTPLNLAGALLERQQRTGNAHVVLSVGRRGVVPPSAPIASNKKSAKGKEKETKQ
ncbi:SART-1 protein [Backusella circina FSU 941]|nr:SART-1 protein [Backusella circina FSU 941]